MPPGALFFSRLPTFAGHPPTPVGAPGSFLMRAPAVLVALSLCGFAANSLLCRFALTRTDIDPASFTAWRLGSGALMLVLLASLRHRDAAWRRGDWRGAAALLIYAVAFSYAYVALQAGIGALLLFGAVQLTMIGAGLAQGERLRAMQWLGVAFAATGLLLLKLPIGGAALSWLPALAMLAAGVAWGIYSLLGRGAGMPLAVTAGNFARAAPVALLLLLIVPHPLRMPSDGVVLAIASGAIASGLGYALWYAVLPKLRASHAGLLQLLVPVLTAAAGVLLLSEPLDLRLVLGATAILGGVALATRRHAVDTPTSR